MSDQGGSGLDHPACPTRGAETAALAAECNKMLVAAGIALNAQEAMLEEAALQVVVELPLDERGGASGPRLRVERGTLGSGSRRSNRVVSLQYGGVRRHAGRRRWVVAILIACVSMGGRGCDSPDRGSAVVGYGLLADFGPCGCGRFVGISCARLCIVRAVVYRAVEFCQDSRLLYLFRFQS
jgi:hypothetical protein